MANESDSPHTGVVSPKLAPWILAAASLVGGCASSTEFSSEDAVGASSEDEELVTASSEDEELVTASFENEEPVTPSWEDEESVGHGDDAYLDGLWEDCDAGDAASCDELYQESPAGSEYEWFGGTCGDRLSTEDLCVNVTASDLTPGGLPPTPDAGLDDEVPENDEVHGGYYGDGGNNNDGMLDPYDNDRDNDGMLDPYDSDADNDGMLDPYDSDADNDGMLDPYDNDRDNDGMLDPYDSDDGWDE